ncbi:MAG: hypothetical protein R3D46_10160 [Defluviimonas denitrificans]
MPSPISIADRRRTAAILRKRRTSRVRRPRPARSRPFPDLPWHLRAIGLTDTAGGPTGAGAVVGPWTPPSIWRIRRSGRRSAAIFLNLDYPMPLNDPWCMSSRGIGHGTAMAGLIPGLEKGANGAPPTGGSAWRRARG